MRTFVLGIVLTLACPAAIWTPICQAEIKATVESNLGDAAHATFAFPTIAPPSSTDAANSAKFTLLSGRADRNGGELAVLNDGAMPSDSDDPRRSYFFAQGTSGGRLLLDLGEPREIQRVNVYSWHRNTRGPQVFKLYAGDGSHAEFDAQPEANADLAQSGWKLLSDVDTRPEGNQWGGQYAVSIADDTAAEMGRWRYLLFEISRTESDDPFGNTFFSEIDILDGRQYDPPPPPAGLETVTLADGTEIVFDTTQMPEIRRWVEEKLKPTCIEWYPKIVELLPSEDYTAPKRFSIVFHKNMDGVAHCSGTEISCAGPWFMRNLQGEAAGAVVHEMVHVVQQYRRGRRGNPNPGWMVEGVADYIRWFLYEPEGKRPRVNPQQANYTDSYRTTAAFLDFASRQYDEQLVRKLNAEMRVGNYSDELWNELTGKPVGELWDEFVSSLTAD